MWHSPTAANSWSAANVDRTTAATAGKPLGMVAGKLIGGGENQTRRRARTTRRPDGEKDRPHTCSETNYRQRRPSKPADLPAALDVCARHLDDPNATPPVHDHRRPPPPRRLRRKTAVWNDDRVYNDIINYYAIDYYLMSWCLVLLFSWLVTVLRYYYYYYYYYRLRIIEYVDASTCAYTHPLVRLPQKTSY